MSETQLANAEAARTETGEIKDQAQSQEGTTQTSTGTETGSEKDQTQGKTGQEETKTEGKDGKSLLNQGEKDGKKEEAAGAPEKYEDFKAPDGFELDSATMEKATPLFKELGLNQDGAQKLVDFYATLSKDAAEAPFKLWADTQEQWVKDVKADSEIGGRIPEVKATISKAVDMLGPELAGKFREAMDFTGAGNNLYFIKAAYKWAQLVTEGSHVSGKGPSEHGQKAPGAAPASAAKALYPNLP